MRLDEAKEILKNAGYIIEDTETNDEEYDQVGKDIDNWKKDWYDPKAKKLLNKHLSLSHKHLDLDDKINYASNFNIKNLFYGVEKQLKKIYKKVEIDASNYDYENMSQLVRFYYTFKKKQYNLEVLYRDEDHVINVRLFADDWYGHERDDFRVTTIDDAIKQIIEFANYNTIGDR